MGQPKFAARCREAGVRFPMVVLSARAWRERSRARGAESPSFEQAGMQESTAAENARRRLKTLNPLVLAVSLEAGIELSTAENALPSCLVGDSESNGLRGRLPSTLGRSREGSTP